MDESAADVKAEAKKPKDDENDDDRPKHKIVLRLRSNYT